MIIRANESLKNNLGETLGDFTDAVATMSHYAGGLEDKIRRCDSDSDELLCNEFDIIHAMSRVLEDHLCDACAAAKLELENRQLKEDLDAAFNEIDRLRGKEVSK